MKKIILSLIIFFSMVGTSQAYTVYGDLIVEGGEATAKNLIYRTDVIGNEIYQNYINFSGDFAAVDIVSGISSWTVENATLTDKGTYQTLSRNAGVPKYLALDQANYGPSGKNLPITFYVTARGEVDKTFKLTAYDFKSPTIAKEYYLDSDWTTMRLDSIRKINTAVILYIRTEITGAKVSYDIKEISLYTTPPPAITGHGDSIANSAKNFILAPLYQSCYLYLLADEFGWSVTQDAADGNELSDILASVTASESTPLGIIEGGVNDLGTAGETIADPTAFANTMLAEMALIIAKAKTKNPYNIILNVPDIPKFSASQTTTAGLYNTGLDTAYGSDSSLAVLDTDDGFVDIDDYTADDIHITQTGHAKIAAQILELRDFLPMHMPKYKYVESYLPILDNADVVNREIPKIVKIDDTDSPYTIIGDNYIVYADTSSNPITINLIPGFSKARVKIINTGANNVSATPDGTELIDGVNAAKTLTKGVLNLSYDTTLGWW